MDSYRQLSNRRDQRIELGLDPHEGSVDFAEQLVKKAVADNHSAADEELEQWNQEKKMIVEKETAKGYHIALKDTKEMTVEMKEIQEMKERMKKWESEKEEGWEVDERLWGTRVFLLREYSPIVHIALSCVYLAVMMLLTIEYCLRHFFGFAEWNLFEFDSFIDMFFYISINYVSFSVVFFTIRYFFLWFLERVRQYKKNKVSCQKKRN
jgi:hypothetical protein